MYTLFNTLLALVIFAQLTISYWGKYALHMIGL